MKTEQNEPINPLLDSNGDTRQGIGLTKRECFAAMAMQGLIAKQGFYQRMCSEALTNSMVEQIAQAALNSADALITALNKQP